MHVDLETLIKLETTYIHPVHTVFGYMTQWFTYIFYDAVFYHRSIDRVYIEGASSRCLNALPLRTGADDLLRCSSTIENLGERGEPDILT